MSEAGGIPLALLRRDPLEDPVEMLALEASTDGQRVF